MWRMKLIQIGPPAEQGGGEGESHIDPVCGMKVASGEGFLVAHGGVEYRFCSLACVEHFERGAPTHGQHAA